MTSQAIPPIYKLHIWIRQISPMIWGIVPKRADNAIFKLTLGKIQPAPS
jgi:hypothetical protein